MLAVRQPDFDTVFTARLDLKDLEGTAGVCAWLQTNYHVRLGIRKEQGNVICSVSRHIHDLDVMTQENAIGNCPKNVIELKIITNREYYEFFAAGLSVAKVHYAGLTTGCTCGNCFTGTLLGIYAENGDAVFVDGISVI